MTESIDEREVEVVFRRREDFLDFILSERDARFYFDFGAFDGFRWVRGDPAVVLTEAEESAETGESFVSRARGEFPCCSEITYRINCAICKSFNSAIRPLRKNSAKELMFRKC